MVGIPTAGSISKKMPPCIPGCCGLCPATSDHKGPDAAGTEDGQGNRFLSAKTGGKPLALPGHAVGFSVLTERTALAGTANETARMKGIQIGAQEGEESAKMPLRAGGYLDEIACEYAEYDAESRAICFTHPETMPDDTLHSLNYALRSTPSGTSDLGQASLCQR